MRRVFCIAAFAIAVVVSAEPGAASGADVIYNFWTNQCLQPVNGSTDQGAAIVREPCNGSAAQQWMETSVGSSMFHYVNALSGLCLGGDSSELWTRPNG